MYLFINIFFYFVGFALKCKSCMGHGCKEEIVLCNKNNSELPDNIGQSYGSNLKKTMTFYGCIDLEYETQGENLYTNIQKWLLDII